MELVTPCPGCQVVDTPGLVFTLIPATVVAAVITQVWITIRERGERSSRQKATLTAINYEFEEISSSLGAFWDKVQNAWDESNRDAIVRFCTLPYPEGSVAAWISSLRTLLPLLSADQIREKIEWLYVAETLSTLRKKLVEDYELFCLYEQSQSMSDGEEIKEMSHVQCSWTMTQIPRLTEYKNALERLQSMRNKLLSSQCMSI